MDTTTSRDILAIAKAAQPALDTLISGMEILGVSSASARRSFIEFERTFDEADTSALA